MLAEVEVAHVRALQEGAEQRHGLVVHRDAVEIQHDDVCSCKPPVRRRGRSTEAQQSEHLTGLRQNASELFSLNIAECVHYNGELLNSLNGKDSCS